MKNECTKEKFEPLNKNFFVWKDQMFRKGFHYKFLKLNKLQTQNVRPSLEEVQHFQLHLAKLGGSSAGTYGFDFESDQDEWDILDDQTLLKTISKDQEVKFGVGDKVKLTAA